MKNMKIKERNKIISALEEALYKQENRIKKLNINKNDKIDILVEAVVVFSASMLNAYKNCFFDNNERFLPYILKLFSEKYLEYETLEEMLKIGE